jgi:dephospho-CoA kinase
MLDALYARAQAFCRISMPIFALTGSLASGKTLTLKLLKKKGAFVFDADERIHKYYQDNKNKIYRKITAAFPQAIEGKKISRDKLGKIVFSDKKKLKVLEKIIHPLIISDLKKWIEKNKKRRGIYVAEVPLLFEKNLENLFDGVVLVYTEKDKIVKRIVRKLHLSRAFALQRLSLFASAAAKKSRADFIINNSFDVKYLKKEVNSLWRKLKALILTYDKN